jgi:hypothetical protein
MLYTKPPEITERRKKEQRLFKTGQYSNSDGRVLVFPVKNSHPRYSEGYKVDVRPYFAGGVVAGPAPVQKPSTAAMAGAGAGAVVVAGTVAAGVQQGWSWLEIGLAGFVAAGIATAIVLLIRKFRT